MKKILSLVGLLLLGSSVSFGADLTINTSTDINTSCNGGTWSESYYLGKTPTRYFYDFLGGDNNKHYLVGMTSSFAAIYNPGVLQFQNGGAFAYKSEIKPRGLDEVILVHQNNGAGTDIVGHAAKRSDIAAQIVYTISRKVESQGIQSTNKTFKYMKTDKSTDSVSTNSAFNSNITTDNECFNIYVGWCGDGVLDNGSSTVFNGQSTTTGQLAGGEQCDEGALNGTPGHCSITCTTGSTSTGKLELTKSLVTNKSYFSGDIMEFRVDFKNNSAVIANNIILQDVLPTSLEFISSELNITGASGGRKIEQGQTVIEYSGFNLQPGQGGSMTIRAKLKVEYQLCIANPINFAFLYANSNPTPLTAQAKFECGQITGTASCQGIFASPTDNTNTRNVICNGTNAPIGTPMKIDCGNGNIYTGVSDSQATFSYACTYTSKQTADSAKISCSVANDTNNPLCTYNSDGACTLEGDAIVAIIDEEDEDNNEVRYTCTTKNGEERLLQIDCGNGEKSDAETDNSLSYTCKYTEDDYDDASDKNKIITAKCLVDNTKACSVDTILDKGFIGICGNNIREGYEQCDEGGYKGSGPTCDEGCIEKCDECQDNVTQCLSIANSNVSVQSKEILPFWWRMYHAEALADSKVKCNWDNYNQFKGVLVKRDSMKCSFSLRQPGQDKPVTFLKKEDCDQSNITGKVLFSNFYPEFRGRAFGTFYKDVDDLLTLSTFDDNTFGEYKIRLHQVDYEYCYCKDENTCDWKDTEIKNVCETDFVITKPYLIQKSAFGTTPKISDTKLTNFYDIKGDQLIKKTDISDVMILDGSSYEGGSKAKKLIINEANKIAKLAVTVAQNKLPDSLKNIGVTVKKVPNKLIYLLEGKNGQTVNIKPFAKFTTPFTFITKNINLVIEGSMDTNGMFVTQNGNITFKEHTDDKTRCSEPQIVRGIFVTDKDFTTSKLENTNLNIKWCMYGNLQVKGILIGNGIDDLVQNRRSNLNQWFRVSGSAKSQQVQRRNQIFNGASLLIEYNPDLWKQLPPGADQFVNLLDIYKK